jgi:class 3 adenylate cyclase/pimeloyl-ACP methyl ester carboxylesterase
MWEHPLIERYLLRLARLGRLILFDKRGSGASDNARLNRGAYAATIEQATEDLVTVLDAVGSRQVDIVSSSSGGWPAMMFAATNPHRVDRLVLQDCIAKLVEAPDYPLGMQVEVVERIIEGIERYWGEGTSLLYYAPELWATNEELRRWVARYERLSADRIMILSTWQQAANFDIRAVLPSVRTPTLVISHRDTPYYDIGNARHLAANLPNAQLVELDGANMFFWGDDRLLDHVVQFLGGDSLGAGDEDDRVLATLLFTDIVGSTRQLAASGDRYWRDILDAHDRVTASLVNRHRGRLVKRTGDGLLALFDGPARAVRCAQAIATSVEQLGVQVRAGVHTGEVEVRGDDVGGMSVHIAARVLDQADAGQVVATRTVKDLTTGGGITFAPLGLRELKGIDEHWELYAVTN